MYMYRLYWSQTYIRPSAYALASIFNCVEAATMFSEPVWLVWNGGSELTMRSIPCMQVGPYIPWDIISALRRGKLVILELAERPRNGQNREREMSELRRVK
jgi:hypothetical protein